MKFEIEMQGFDQLRVLMEQTLGERVSLDAIAPELNQIAEETMAASKLVVPVDTGNLMSTGHVAPIERDERSVSVTLGYGGPAAPYALMIHEDMNPNRRWKRPGSGPKYLENPMKEKEPEISERIAKVISEELKR